MALKDNRIYVIFSDGETIELNHDPRINQGNLISLREMGMADRPAVVAKLAKVEGYDVEFKKAFGRAPNYEDLEKALAAFERTLIFLDAPFDRFRAGDAGAISESAQRGLALFEGKARCTACHPKQAGKTCLKNSICRSQA